MCLTAFDEHYQVFVLLVGALLAFVLAPVLICLWWRYTARSPLVLAAAYFALASVASLLGGAGGGNLLWSVVSDAVGLPWGFFFRLSGYEAWCGEVQRNWALVGAGLNAGVVQLLARRAVRLEEQYQRWAQANKGINRTRAQRLC